MFADTKNELNKIPQKSGKVSEAERNYENVSKLIEVFLYFSASLRFYLPPRTLFGVTRCRVVSISAADSGCLSCIDVLCFSSVRLISCTNMHIGVLSNSIKLYIHLKMHSIEENSIFT